MAEEPTFFEKIKNLLGGGDDKPTPVAGGRGRTVERPNERSDYLAKILDDQFAPVPPPNVPPVPKLFNQFNDASGNIFRPYYNPETEKFELIDNAPSQMTLNKGDITEKAVGYIPPQFRDPFMIGGQYDRSIPHALIDNLIGLDDGFESTGEALGRKFNEDELGFLLDMGIGAAKGAYNLLTTNPKTTVSNYVGGVGDAFKRLKSNEGTADQKLGDLLMVGSVVPAGQAVRLGADVATIPLKKQASRFNDPYMESERLLAARGFTNVGTDKNPRYTGVERPSFIPDARTSSTETIAEYRGRKKLADYLYENGATHAEVINTAGINRVTYKTPSGEPITRDFMLLERPQINVEEALKMVEETKDRLIANPDGTFDFKPDFKGYESMEDLIYAMAAGKISQDDLAKRPGTRFLSELLNNPEDFAFLSNDFSGIKVKPESLNIENKFEPRGGAYHDVDGGEITYNPKNLSDPELQKRQTAYIIGELLDHEMEHGIQARGDKVLFREGSGGPDTAEAYRDKRLDRIGYDLMRIEDVVNDPNSNLNPAQLAALGDYSSKLQNELDALDRIPEELYMETPSEVLARGAERVPLTTYKQDVPITGLFNPYIKGQITPLSQGIGALIKDYKQSSDRLGHKKTIERLPFFLTKKGYGRREVPIAYEEMVPYAVKTGNRPDQILGMPF
tara:strand:- start:168 stop:2201 length:2034 start_codon:yes stop_codon:yes gene_type:complete